MVKNCFTCLKAKNCNDYDVCNAGSLWKQTAENKIPERRLCDNCKFKSSRGCKKAAYPVSSCINQEYLLWEHEEK